MKLILASVVAKGGDALQAAHLAAASASPSRQRCRDAAMPLSAP